MNMMKVCGKMLSKVRLEKILGTSVDERAIYYKILNFTIKYLIFRETWKIPYVVKIFPVLYLNSLCFPCLEKLITKFPVFPGPWPTWSIVCAWMSLVHNGSSRVNSGQTGAWTSNLLHVEQRHYPFGHVGWHSFLMFKQYFRDLGGHDFSKQCTVKPLL